MQYDLADMMALTSACVVKLYYSSQDQLPFVGQYGMAVKPSQTNHYNSLSDTQHAILTHTVYTLSMPAVA